MENLSVGQYDLIYNAFSFAFATLAAATIFFWLGRSQVAPQYKTAMTITGLVTFIAAYHYFASSRAGTRLSTLPKARSRPRGTRSTRPIAMSTGC